jgi:hypothetical protein
MNYPVKGSSISCERRESRALSVETYVYEVF